MNKFYFRICEVYINIEINSIYIYIDGRKNIFMYLYYTTKTKTVN